MEKRRVVFLRVSERSGTGLRKGANYTEGSTNINRLECDCSSGRLQMKSAIHAGGAIQEIGH